MMICQVNKECPSKEIICPFFGAFGGHIPGAILCDIGFALRLLLYTKKLVLNFVGIIATWHPCCLAPGFEYLSTVHTRVGWFSLL
jgi:hypothetical protein